MITKITDHVDQAKDRYSSQFKGKTNIGKLMTVLIEPVQRFENVGYDVLTQRGLDNAVGAQLDRIGRIIKEKRNGDLDEAYRRRLRAWIKAHKSNGTVNELIAITSLIIDDTDADIIVTQEYPAALTIEVQNIVVTTTVAETLIRLLRKARSGGIKLILRHWPVEEDEMFTFARAAFLDGALTGGETTLDVNSTEGFPTSGELKLSEALTEEEDVTYTGKTATSFTGVSAVVNAHEDGATVTLIGSPGLGLGDDADADIGGSFAGAEE